MLAALCRGSAFCWEAHALAGLAAKHQEPVRKSVLIKDLPVSWRLPLQRHSPVGCSSDSVAVELHQHMYWQDGAQLLCNLPEV